MPDYEVDEFEGEYLIKSRAIEWNEEYLDEIDDIDDEDDYNDEAPDYRFVHVGRLGEVRFTIDEEAYVWGDFRAGNCCSWTPGEQQDVETARRALVAVAPHMLLLLAPGPRLQR